MAKAALALVVRVIRSVLFLSLGSGIFLFLRGRDIYLDQYVAAGLNMAATPENLFALSLFVVGVLGLALFVVWEVVDVPRLFSGKASAPSIPSRIPLVDLRELAAEAGWNTDVHAASVGDNDFWTFMSRLREAATDGVIGFWGRKYVGDWSRAETDAEPRVKIDKDHFRDFGFDVVELATAKNFDIFTGKLSQSRSDLRGQIYRDLYVDELFARAWLKGRGAAPEPAVFNVAIKTTGAAIGSWEELCAEVGDGVTG